MKDSNKTFLIMLSLLFLNCYRWIFGVVVIGLALVTLRLFNVVDWSWWVASLPFTVLAVVSLILMLAFRLLWSLRRKGH